jgi:predicted nucleic acid-binding protein
MVYLDASVALAHLLAEDRRPASEFWQEPIITSRLLEYEIRTVMNLRPAVRLEDEVIRGLIGRIALIELIPEILQRARERFPLPLRTLDALHLASATFLINEGVKLELATYDKHMSTVAKKLKIPLYRKL